MLILLSVIVALVVTTLALVVARPLLLRRQIADRPGEGRSHDKVTARGGGIAILIGLLAGSSLAFFDTSFTQPYGRLVAFLLGAASFSLLGWIDDVTSDFKWWVRLLAQVVISTVVAWLAFAYCDMSPLLAVLVALAGIFYVNAANFMDGINGISAMHGMAAGVFFLGLGYLLLDPTLMIVAAAVASAFAAFLPWNSPRAHLFMGDSGAYLLGGAVWGMAWWSLSIPWVHAPLWVVVAPVLIYSLDVLWTLASRAARGKNLTERHREHIFTRFSDKTSHLTSALVVTMATMVCSAAGLMMQLPLTPTSSNRTLVENRVPIGITVYVLALGAYLSLPVLMRRSADTDPDKFETGE